MFDGSQEEKSSASMGMWTEPGGQKNSEINDALYPAGTAWYKIRITGAKASVQ